jgi:hypothetical protein
MKRLLLVAFSLVALSLLVQPLHAQAKKAAGKSQTASGTVKSVSASSLTITAAGGKDMTFSIDAATKIVGKGLTTKSKTTGGKLPPSEAVSVNDQVTVSYQDMSGSMHASEVHVTAKGKK